MLVYGADQARMFGKISKDVCSGVFLYEDKIVGSFSAYVPTNDDDMCVGVYIKWNNRHYYGYAKPKPRQGTSPEHEISLFRDAFEDTPWEGWIKSDAQCISSELQNHGITIFYTVFDSIKDDEED